MTIPAPSPFDPSIPPCDQVTRGEDGAPRPFVVEVKVDGERTAVHVKGRQVLRMHSRAGIDHAASGRGYELLGPALLAQLVPDDVILDGEMVVWNHAR